MTDHYFSTEPTSADRRRDVTVTLAGRPLTLETSTGVFSAHGLDQGTAVLLRKATIPADISADDGDPRGVLLDLGCGWGPIAISLALECPNSRVIAVDVNERARELTASNAERAGVTVEVYSPEDAMAAVREAGGIRHMWSNPPVRIGKEALHALLSDWLSLLTPDGYADLVVSKNLGSDSLAGWLTGEGWTVDKLGSAKGFRVLEVSRS